MAADVVIKKRRYTRRKKRKYTKRLDKDAQNHLSPLFLAGVSVGVAVARALHS